MYSHQLNTFLRVADIGSFNKAAEELLISPPAVIKQINALESELEVSLFVRTHRGLILTDAGKSFYKDAKYILQYYAEAVRRAQTAEQKNDHILRIGTSPMTPGQFLIDLWPQIHPYLPDMKFQLVPFENTPENARGVQNFGQEVDLVVGVLDDQYLRERKCAATMLSVEPLRVAVPIRHRLAGKDILSMEDLCEENLMLIRRGWNAHMDALRDDIEKHYPDISIVNFDFYATEAYNQCEFNNHLILTIDRWKDVHPLLKVLPVQWEYTVPFGILHAQKPSKNVLKFLRAIEDVVGKVH